MPPSYPSGIQFMEVMIDGRRVIIQYGGPAVRNLAAEFGMGVLRLPDYCVTLRPHQESLFHVGESWVRGPHYPFVAHSSTDSLSVVPLKSRTQEHSLLWSSLFQEDMSPRHSYLDGLSYLMRLSKTVQASFMILRIYDISGSGIWLCQELSNSWFFC